MKRLFAWVAATVCLAFAGAVLAQDKPATTSDKPAATAQAKVATGFHFIDASTDALLSAILLSLQVYREPDAWHSLMQAGMQTDVSWTQAAKQYGQLYRSVIEEDANGD